MMEACPCPGPPGSNPNPRILFLLLRFSKCVLSLGFPAKTLYGIHPMHATCLAHIAVIVLDLLIRIIFVVDWINVAEDRDSGGQLLSE